MNNSQKEEFNLQIRKILKEFGVKAHGLVEKGMKIIFQIVKYVSNLKLTLNQ